MSEFNRSLILEQWSHLHKKPVDEQERARRAFWNDVILHHPSESAALWFELHPMIDVHVVDGSSSMFHQWNELEDHRGVWWAELMDDVLHPSLGQTPEEELYRSTCLTWLERMALPSLSVDELAEACARWKMKNSSEGRFEDHCAHHPWYVVHQKDRLHARLYHRLGCVAALYPELAQTWPIPEESSSALVRMLQPDLMSSWTRWTTSEQEAVLNHYHQQGIYLHSPCLQEKNIRGLLSSLQDIKTQTYWTWVEDILSHMSEYLSSIEGSMMSETSIPKTFIQKSIVFDWLNHPHHVLSWALAESEVKNISLSDVVSSWKNERGIPFILHKFAYFKGQYDPKDDWLIKAYPPTAEELEQARALHKHLVSDEKWDQLIGHIEQLILKNLVDDHGQALDQNTNTCKNARARL